MFTTDFYIDQFQAGKKQFVKTFVTDDKIADIMNQFIDNQAEYTKKAAKATTDAGTTLTQETLKHIGDSFKFDYLKFGEGIMKAYSAQNNPFGFTKK